MGILIEKAHKLCLRTEYSRSNTALNKGGPRFKNRDLLFPVYEGVIWAEGRPGSYQTHIEKGDRLNNAPYRAPYLTVESEYVKAILRSAHTDCHRQSVQSIKCHLLKNYYVVGASGYLKWIVDNCQYV